MSETKSSWVQAVEAFGNMVKDIGIEAKGPIIWFLILNLIRDILPPIFGALTVTASVYMITKCIIMFAV